jgi:signal transduction histidine kinase
MTVSISSGRARYDLISALVLGLGTFAVGMDAFAIAGFLPSMAGELHVSIVDGGQSVTAFVVAYAVLAPVLALTTARVPRRVLLIGALLLLSAANLGSALAPTLPVLIASRVLAAAGAAAYTPIAVAVCATLVRPGHRARALAVIVGGMTLATALGSLAGDRLGWRAAMGMVSLVCLLACAGVLLTMPALPGRARLPLGAMATVLRRSAPPVLLSISVLGMAAAYAVYSYRVPALSDAAVPEIVAVLTLFLYGVGAVLLNAVSGLREAREERLRIARELHDSLTHNISVIKTQTGIAVYLARQRGEPVPETLLAIQEASGEAMRELRATLQVLRDPVGEPVVATGLDRLPGLVDRARSAGLRTAVTVSGERRALPPEVDSTAYRIVQEALTNVSRHAGDASALVEISHRPDAVTVRVDDDGQATPGKALEPGIGLTGMRERVVELGGRLQAGPRPGGGFTVLAELPVTRRPSGVKQAARAAVARLGTAEPALTKPQAQRAR